MLLTVYLWCLSYILYDIASYFVNYELENTRTTISPPPPPPKKIQYVFNICPFSRVKPWVNQFCFNIWACGLNPKNHQANSFVVLCYRSLLLLSCGWNREVRSFKWKLSSVLSRGTVYCVRTKSIFFCIPWLVSLARHTRVKHPRWVHYRAVPKYDTARYSSNAKNALGF